MNNACRAVSYCGSAGRCIEDDPKCPTASACLCFECYYGSRCQLSSKGISLSLDLILGYHILPHIYFVQQPLVVQISSAINIIIVLGGFISSMLSLITFQRKKTRAVGCGFYIIMSSLTTLFIVTMFAIKFWLLIFSQMSLIVNRYFLQFNCSFIDFLLRIFLTTSDWFNTCVSVERAFTVVKGPSFNKLKSKRAAKWVIIFVILFTTITSIHDPIHRHLIDDEEEQRTWCVSKFSSSVQILNSVTTFCHLLIPFGFNLIAAFVIIVVIARRRSKSKQQLSYKQHLRQQFQQHKYLLISPCAFVLLTSPRLIISFLTGCMKSAREPWIFLIGYFISFIPPCLVFAIFVLPSNLYKKEFKEAMKHIRQKFHR